LPIRMSRKKVDREQVLSQGTLSFNCGHLSDCGLIIYKSVKEAGTKARPYDRTVGRAKTVTSL